MAKKRIPYKTGSWFAVPLRSGGFGIGIVSRHNGDGIVFGYFFGPIFQRVPSISEVPGKRPTDAVLVGRFGDLELIKGNWPIIGQQEPWKPDVWTLSPFVRIDDNNKRGFLVHYSDPSLTILSEEECDPGLIDTYPYDRLMGAGSVEIRLTKLLGAK